MRKNGFTLIELLAVIIILAVIALIATPLVINVVTGAKAKANEASIYGYADGLKLAVYDYMYKEDTFGQKPNVDKTWAEANMELNNKEVSCEGVFYNDTYSSVLNKCKVSDSEKEYCLAKGKIYECDNSEFTTILGETGGNVTIKPNTPDLLTNMIPIKYDGINWIYADTNQAWYNYDNKEWANAIILNSGVTKSVGQTVSETDIALWYVWIPRYKYTIFNGNNEGVPEQVIDVTFESGTTTTGTVSCTTATSGSETGKSENCTDTTNGSITNGISTYTHPAYTFGTDSLRGIWVGKFEVSSTDSTCLSNPSDVNCNKIHTIKTVPNVMSLAPVNVSNYYTSIRNIETDYGISNGDSHMMKNMEWGVVAYLKQSKYGLGTTDIGMNDNQWYTTGCGATAGSSDSTICNAYNTTNGMLASTTGNIYGVYDMSGGSEEYVMGNMVNKSNGFNSSDSGFTSAPNPKYYDAYTYNTYTLTKSRGRLGDATSETLSTHDHEFGGWTGDYAYFVYERTSSCPWFVRGGTKHYYDMAGVFSSNCAYGSGLYSGFSTRAVLVAK